MLITDFPFRLHRPHIVLTKIGCVYERTTLAQRNEKSLPRFYALDVLDLPKQVRTAELENKWEGSQESVPGSSFEHVRMVNVEATGEMLKKLEPFGKRKKEHVFEVRP